LANIAQSKRLYSNAQLLKRKIGHEDIGYQKAQGKRATKFVTRPPAGVVHDYVPFYFAPRSPMLFTINNGNVSNCPYRQEDFVHFMTTVEEIVENQLHFVFYDHNATMNFATCYNDVKDLDKIEWNLFFELPHLDGYCKWWKNDPNNPKYVKRMETRQAEFLVYESVPLKIMSTVGVYNAAKATEVSQIFEAAKIKLKVEVKQS
jgi:hypothetical protein